MVEKIVQGLKNILDVARCRLMPCEGNTDSQETQNITSLKSLKTKIIGYVQEKKRFVGKKDLWC